MAIPSRFKTKEEAPEWAREHLVLEKDKDGKETGFFLLDVEGQRPKAVVDDFRTQNETLKKEREQLQRDLLAVQDQLKQAKSPQEYDALETRVAELQRKLDEGQDEGRIKELLAKRQAALRIGDREIRVAIEDKPFLESELKKYLTEKDELSKTSASLLDDLTQERMVGGTTAAVMKLQKFRPNAYDDIQRYVREKFVMGEIDGKRIPYIPDLTADKTGKTPVMSKDGKPVSIEQELTRVIESGEKNGVWLEAPGGPAKLPRPAGGAQQQAPHGASRIAKGLAAREKGA